MAIAKKIVQEVVYEVTFTVTSDEAYALPGRTQFNNLIEGAFLSSKSKSILVNLYEQIVLAIDGAEGEES